MNDYHINVTEIETLQTINNIPALEKIFSRAKSVIVNGALVILERKDVSGVAHPFDGIDTLELLEAYKDSVFRYLRS